MKKQLFKLVIILCILSLTTAASKAKNIKLSDEEMKEMEILENGEGIPKKMTPKKEEGIKEKELLQRELDLLKKEKELLERENKLLKTGSKTSIAASNPKSILLAAEAFQDKEIDPAPGIPKLDISKQILKKDDIWAPGKPEKGSSLKMDFFANGTNGQAFDAMALKFNISGKHPATLKLRLYMQRGSYTSGWEHMLILPGWKNTQHEDNDPCKSCMDLYPGRWGKKNDTLGWIEIPLDAGSDHRFSPTPGSLELTIRLWNFRVDAVEIL